MEWESLSYFVWFNQKQGLQFHKRRDIVLQVGKSLPFFSNDAKTAVQVDSDKNKACFYLEQNRNPIPGSLVKQILAIFTLKLIKKLGIVISNPYSFK